MQAAECVADVLRDTPGTSEIQTRILYGKDGAEPSVEWRFSVMTGRRRLTRVIVAAAPGEDFFTYERTEGRIGPADPSRLIKEWRNQCRVREYGPLLLTT